MEKLEDLGEVISTDLLIVGGGLTGLVAAIKAKEQSPEVDVLVVDKAAIGFSGKAPKSHGLLMLLAPEDDLNRYVEYHVRDRHMGDYLADQELLYSLMHDSYAAIEELGEMGAKLAKDEQGKLITMKHPFYPHCSMTGVAIDMLIPLRAKARKMGVKMLNRVEVVELLKQDGRVVGTVGFNIIDGRFYTFKAKATILANGSINYKVLRMWYAGCGEGIAAAYRAGAEMRNAEFGNFYGLWQEDTDDYARLAHSYLFNAKGESLAERFEPEGIEDTMAQALGMEREVNEGRGPIYLDLQKVEYGPELDNLEKMTKSLAVILRALSKVRKYGLASEKPEAILGLHAELSPIKVDHEMKTTLDGLWASGDTCAAGSAWAGATPMPGPVGGLGLMGALLYALRAGPSAARYAAKAALPEVDYTEVERFREEIFAPMRRDKGLLPIDAIYAIQDVVCPLKYNLRRSGDRLEEALSKVKEVQQRLPELWAKDGHGLLKCHEATSMVLGAEMTFRAALMRTESRGWHFREDYPERDDKNWLKWIVIKQEAGKMVLSTEPVPIDKYKVKP